MLGLHALLFIPLRRSEGGGDQRGIPDRGLSLRVLGIVVGENLRVGGEWEEEGGGGGIPD